MTEETGEEIMNRTSQTAVVPMLAGVQMMQQGVRIWFSLWGFKI
ncbi:MAG: hypothetical protein ACI9H6_000036 [Patiriisocius sp.]|jgi:hypothetical protein